MCDAPHGEIFIGALIISVKLGNLHDLYIHERHWRVSGGKQAMLRAQSFTVIICAAKSSAAGGLLCFLLTTINIGMYPIFL